MDHLLLSLSLPAMSICSLMPSRMDSSIFLATSMLLGSDLSPRSLQIFQHLSYTFSFRSAIAFRSQLSSPCLVMLRHSSSLSMRCSCERMLRSSGLVVSYLHSAMMAPANSLMSKVSPPCSISSCATFIWFYSQLCSSFEKSASDTTAKVQNCRVYRSSSSLLAARQRSSTRRPTPSSRFWLGTIMKSTVLRWAGFHLMYPALVVPSTYFFSSWLKMSPSFSWGRHLVYLRIMKSVMLNLGQVSRKKSLMRTSISEGRAYSISLHRRKLVAHSSRSLRGASQMFLPRCTSASNTKYLICPPFSFINSPSRISTTVRFAPYSSVEAASNWVEMAMLAAQAVSLPWPCRLTKKNSVQGGSSPGRISLVSSLGLTLATMSKYLTPSVFSQTRQGDWRLLLRVLKISLQVSLVMETGCPPKKESFFRPSYHIFSSSLTTCCGTSTGLPGASTEMNSWPLGCSCESDYYCINIRLQLTALSQCQWECSGGGSQQQMDFFNKYKNLFEIPQGLSVPQSRLRLDNTLFVEKVYMGTTQQEYSLNNKLRQLKKDYTEFETEMNEIAAFKKTPVRSLSRRGKDKEDKPLAVSLKNNENREYPDYRPQLSVTEKKVDLQREKRKMVSDAAKRDSWLQDEHRNILKHSEIDHIFNNKLNKIYDLDEIKPSTLPKVQHSDNFSMDSQSKRNNFMIKQRSRKSEGRSPNGERKQGSAQTALARREKAKSTLQFRRKKLQQLLRSLW